MRSLSHFILCFVFFVVLFGHTKCPSGERQWPSTTKIESERALSDLCWAYLHLIRLPTIWLGSTFLLLLYIFSLSLSSFLFGCCLKPISYSFEAGSSLPTLLSAYRSCFSFHFILSRCRCSAKSEQRSCASLISTTQRLICFLILLLLGPPLYGNRLD